MLKQNNYFIALLTHEELTKALWFVLLYGGFMTQLGRMLVAAFLL